MRKSTAEPSVATCHTLPVAGAVGASSGAEGASAGVDSPQPTRAGASAMLAAKTVSEVVRRADRRMRE
jgi:hypothetical protein